MVDFMFDIIVLNLLGIGNLTNIILILILYYILLTFKYPPTLKTKVFNY